MTRASAVGSGPVVHYAEDGTETIVPLSAITFVDGQLDIKGGYSVEIQNWIKYLVNRKDIVAGPAETPIEAVLATAKFEGWGGNKIEVEISEGTDPTKVNVVAREVDIYERMTLDTLEKRLGTDTDVGTEPGLFRVKDFVAGLPAPSPGKPTMKPGGGRPNCTLVSSGGDAIVIEAANTIPGLTKDNFVVEIKDVDPTANPPTFTLITSWENRVDDATAGDLLDAATMRPLSYLVTFSAPAGGGSLPRPDVVRLSGGNEQVDAKKSTGTLLGNP